LVISHMLKKSLAHADKQRWKNQYWEPGTSVPGQSSSSPSKRPETLSENPTQLDWTSKLDAGLTPRKTLRYHAESYDIKGTATPDSGISTKLSSPREEPTCLEGFTVSVLGEIIAGVPRVSLEVDKDQPFWAAAQQAAPPSLVLGRPDF